MARSATRVEDPARLLTLLTLLWSPPERAARSGLTVPAITAAAVALADADGLAAVTMRRVAEALGTGTMSLYTHVPGKPELVELMVDHAADRVYAEGDRPDEVADWRAGVRRVAEANWSHHLRHPWTVEVTPGRPVLGPGVCGKYETELAPFDGIGLSDVEMDLALSALLGLVESSARWQIGLDRTRAESGVGDPGWWEQVGPVLAQAMQGREYPLGARVGTAAGEQYQSAGDPQAQLRFGVECFVAGVEQLLTGAHRGGGPAGG